MIVFAVILVTSVMTLGATMRGRRVSSRLLASAVMGVPVALLTSSWWLTAMDALYTEKVASDLIHRQIRIVDAVVVRNGRGGFEIEAEYDDPTVNEVLLLPQYPDVQPLSWPFWIAFGSSLVLCFGVSSIPRSENSERADLTIPAP